MAHDWSVRDIGDLRGRTAVVTGANSGIGFYTALELGRAGAVVVAACRDATRGQDALQKLRDAAPGAAFRLEALDLGDLGSVRRFAGGYLATGAPLDLLVNNAGLMMPPEREVTADGFERQFGVNHLGHFALTGLLLGVLRLSPSPRVVVVSSGAAAWGRIDFANLQSEQRYKRMQAYGQSKLANLLFMLELGRRAPWIIAVAAHPGATVTNLQQYAFRRTTGIVGQHASQGALPTLRAAVSGTRSGTYFGPNGWFQMRGTPIEVPLPGHARGPEVARALWEVSERLTGVHYAFDAVV
jgi:NAD(P)-dependent dehydrogenase (short-subunit alcohol dehydrogenase family)